MKYIKIKYSFICFLVMIMTSLSTKAEIVIPVDKITLKEYLLQARAKLPVIYSDGTPILGGGPSFEDCKKLLYEDVELLSRSLIIFNPDSKELRESLDAVSSYERFLAVILLQESHPNVDLEKEKFLIIGKNTHKDAEKKILAKITEGNATKKTTTTP